MHDFATDATGLLRNADFLRSGRHDRELRRAVERGELVTVTPGVHLPREVWAAAKPSERHLLRAAAFAPRLGPQASYSHATAVAAHGWSTLDENPRLLDVIDPTVGKTRRGVVARLRAADLCGLDLDSVHGLPVTSAGRTAVDVVAESTFRDAVVIVDSALRADLERTRAAERGSPAPATPPTPLTLAEFDAALERRRPVRAHNHVARVREFVDARAGSAGESLSRVVVRERGWPAPELQHAFRDSAGDVGMVDFWWPDFGIIGEFDGAVKYSRGEYLRGRTAAEAVIDEKRREDRLRALPEVRGFARWMWGDVTAPWKLARILGAAGLPV